MNGWTNRETWLVNLWYGSEMPQYFADSEVYHVTPIELADAVEGITLECEAMSQLGCGLLLDFINDAFREVNWHELAEHVNAELAQLEGE